METYHQPPIQPKPKRSSEQAAQLAPTYGITSTPLFKRPRTNVKVACHPCRSRKLACDGCRPRCGKCVDQGRECSYEAVGPDETRSQALKRQVQMLEEKLTQHADFLNHLKASPEEDALALVRALRDTPDPSQAVMSLQGAMDSRQRPSDYQLARAVSPPTDSDIEFELLARHHPIYPRSIAVDFLPDHLTPAGRNIGIEREKQILASEAGETSQSINQNGPQAALEGDIRPSAPLFRANTYWHQLLKGLDVAFWTRVTVSNAYAAGVISHFLQIEHVVLAAFDADLFVKDLVEKRLRFCSPFLVSSLMYLACQPYTFVDKNAAVLKLQFFEEAEYLFKQQRELPASPINVPAIIILSQGCTFQGKDALARELLATGRRMAKELGLLDVKPDEAILADDRDVEWKKAISSFAWGAYSWLGLHSLFYPDDPVEYPPFHPMPGESASNVGADTLMQAFLGYPRQTFTSCCQLWVIAQSVSKAHADTQRPSYESEDCIKFVEQELRQLLSWADGLGPKMARTDKSPWHVTLFHMFYHQVVIGMLRPLIRDDRKNPAKDKVKLRSLWSADASPEAISATSIKQLKRLAFDYYFMYPTELHILHVNAALVQLVNHCLQHQSDADARTLFLFCVRYWRDFYVCYPMFIEVTKAYLSMAIRDDLLTTKEATQLIDEVGLQGQHHDTTEQPIVNFIADTDLVFDDPKEAEASGLASRFAELGLFQDITEGAYIGPEYPDDGPNIHATTNSSTNRREAGRN